MGEVTDLRAWREAHGYSQTQIARLLKVPLRTWCAWERGERPPTYGRMLELALERIAKTG